MIQGKARDFERFYRQPRHLLRANGPTICGNALKCRTEGPQRHETLDYCRANEMERKVTVKTP